MPRAWRVKESHHGRSLKQKDTQRFFILLFPKKVSGIFQEVSSSMGADNSACNGERGGLVGACGTRGGDGDGAASRARDLKSQVSCGDGLA